MRRRVLLFSLLLVPALAPGMPARADEFVPGTEDLPLMPGLSPVAGSSLVFDKPEGRIVEAQAKGKLTRDAVARFYVQTLPQLGWSAAGANLWRREGERLKLEYRGPDGNLTVGFTLSPLPQ
jgi:hypothetical protein